MMIKVFVLIALAVVGAKAQETEPASEPYSYAYTADSHAASEQRDPQGKVTGFYNIVDQDGRERRVDYVADEAGFRAKIATNEVGTKSQNPADVEINASEPSPQQFALYQQAPVAVSQVQQPVRTQQVAYAHQQPQYGYYSSGYYGAPGHAYGQAYGNGYGYGYNSGLLNVGNYNNHLPSQYYRSISTTAPATYTVNGVNSGYRYVNQPAVSTVNSGYRYVSQPAVSGVSSSYRYVSQPAVSGVSSSYGYVGQPAVSGVRTVSYGVAPSSVNSRPSNSQGSSNYLVIQKRATDEKKN